MAKTRCIICKSCNVLREAKKHPNTQTIGDFIRTLTLISSRAPEVIETICEIHRNPLQFNIITIDLFKHATLLQESLRTEIPMSAMRF